MRQLCLILCLFTAVAYGCGPTIVLGVLNKEDFPEKLGEIYDHIVETAQRYDSVIRRPFPWREAHHAERFPRLLDLLTAKKKDHRFDALFEDSEDLRKNEAGVLEILLMMQQVLNYSMYSFESAYVRQMNPENLRTGIVALLTYKESLLPYFDKSDELILASFDQDSPEYFRERNELLQEWLDAVLAYLRTYVYYYDKFCNPSGSSNK